MVQPRSPSSDPGPDGGASWRRFLPLAVLVAGLVVFFALGGHRYIALDALERHREALLALVADHAVLAVAGFIAAYAVMVAFSIPGALVMTVGAGFLFGTLGGAACSVVGATLGSIALFLAARTALGDLLRDRATGTLDSEVTETELAGRYGVSRAVLSRALARLASQGLIERQRGHGWRFADALESERAHEESYEFRVAIECAALGAAHFQADARQLADMRRRHEEILAAPERVGSRVWFDTNAAFHEMIAAFSGNRFFQQAIRYQNDLRRLREHAEFSSLSRARIEQSCREHLEILSAIEQDDRDWATALLRRHLDQALDYSGLPD